MSTTLCPICRSKTHDFADVRGDFDDEIYHLSRCAGCSLIFLDPLPKHDLEPTFQTYTTRNRGFHNLFRLLKEIFIVRPIIRRVKGLTQKNHPRVLDVGCGTGWISDVWQRSGCNVVGIEPSEAWAGEASARYELTVHNMSFETFVSNNRASTEGGNSFDIVIFDHVFEHFTEPVKTLTEAATLLNPNGLIVINTPNVECLARKILGRRWWWFVPNHKIFLGPTSFNQLAKSCHMNIILIHHQLTCFNIITSLQTIIKRSRFGFLARILNPGNIILHILFLPLSIFAKITRRSEAITVIIGKPGQRDETPHK